MAIAIATVSSNLSPVILPSSFTADEKIKHGLATITTIHDNFYPAFASNISFLQAI